MDKKEKIIEKIKKNKVGIIICSILFLVFLLLNIVRITTNNSYNNISVSDNAPTLTHNIRRVNNFDVTTSVNLVSLDIPNNLTRNSNITNIPSGTWFAYFSINPTDNSGIRWTNVYQNIYHLEYVVKGAVIDYVTYTYVGGVNYEWQIGKLDNGILSEIGFKTIQGGYLINEKRNLDNPEIIVSSLEHYDYFINSFLVHDVNYNYEYNLNFETQKDFELFSANNSQLMYLFNNYTCDNQLKTIINKIPYKIDETLQYEYEAYYNSGYNNGYDEGYEKGSQGSYGNGLIAGVNIVKDNPKDYGLYTYSEYINNYDTGYDLGYNTGFADAESPIEKQGFLLMFNSILNAPYNILNGIFNFELFGINLFNLFSFIITCGLILFVVKIFI